ncbi:predicted protein [Uncinocarpus reesii 1704]|uniref:Uncharacterized protein n=1 Tax=Uncinocarpus reesii (strain UAMH 1704) TaxID=336963 RepID=C4JR98_UNCRE|nr:uncharacterized protein UREG_04987 [Uncinocarpus reesii 1704]EEP80145.1 predicted protein [Uncinocarpus reesii 1704]
MRTPSKLFRPVSTVSRTPSSRKRSANSGKWAPTTSRTAASLHGFAVPQPNSNISASEPFAGEDTRSPPAPRNLEQGSAAHSINVQAILEEAQPGRILAALKSSAELQNAIQEVPAATYVELLRLLSPAYFIEPYKELHAHLHPLTAHLNRILPLTIRMAQFAEQLDAIVKLRRRAGHRLGLAEYTQLLSCSASMGYGQMASFLWTEMGEDGIEPTVECYNYLMEAKVWDRAYIAKENHRVRSTQWIYDKRRRYPRNPGYRGYRTGKDGVRDQVHQLFRAMVASGLIPNEATFINVMTAASREWDMKTVKTTLQTVWGIDVDLLENDPGSHPPVSIYATSSPLHPTPRLLHAVAHIFGSNNDFSMALKLVDFVSQSYNIPIPQRVWQELLEWSFVLSLERFGDSGDSMVGKIPRNSPVKVFEVLTSSPYNASPNFKMYNILFKVAWIKQSKDTFDHMKSGRELFRETLRTRNRLFHRLLRRHGEIASTRNLNNPLDINPSRRSNQPDDDEVLPKPAHEYRLAPLFPSITCPGDYWDLYNTVKSLNIKVARELLYIQRWIRLILTRRKWRGTKEQWERLGVPNFIEEWKEFLPYQVFYHTKTGVVEFDPSSFWPEGHRWDLASFMLPLWDAENRLLSKSEQETFLDVAPELTTDDDAPGIMTGRS